MNYKTLTIFFLTGWLIAGCGLVDTDTVNDDNIDDNLKPIATNCADNVENAYGCYGDTKTFGVGALKITGGVWSIYSMSTLPVGTQSESYDTYEYGYKFDGDGTAFKRSDTATYSESLKWGVSQSGDQLTVSSDGTYVYEGRFGNDKNCFKVSNKLVGESIKMCSEDSVDTSHKNSAGYYGNGVTFGNYTHGNYEIVGKWEITGTNSITVTLDSNGTTSNGGEWGVSEDGKRIGIDGVNYLVHKYPKSEDCIEVFELIGETITPQIRKMCKQP